MGKISLVIPGFTITKDIEEATVKCIKSYKYYAKEIIFTEDGGRYSPQIMSLVDSYIYNWENKGFSVNVNRGWRYCSGDYVAIVSSDTYLYEGDINDLCIPGKVTSPEVVNQNIPRLAGSFFVTPKEITKERGYLFEEMRTYASDSEYDHRVKDIFQKVPSVKIFHYQAMTVTQAGVEGGDEMQRDREAYAQLIREGKGAA